MLLTFMSTRVGAFLGNNTGATGELGQNIVRDLFYWPWTIVSNPVYAAPQKELSPVLIS